MNENEKKKKEFCKWKKYIYKTICPKEHESERPYWMIPENLEGFRYCPYCGKEVVVED